MEKSFSIRSLFSASWGLYTQRPLFYIGLTIVPTLITIGINMIIGLSSSAFEQVTNGSSDNAIVGLSALVVSISLNIFSWIFSLLMTTGTTVAYIDVVRERRPTLSFLFNQKHHLVRYIITSIIIGAVFFAGFLFFIIPGFFWVLVTFFAPYFVVDQSEHPIKAIQRSIDLTKGVRIKIFVYLLSTLGINIIGALFFGVGLLVTIPFTSLATAKLFILLQEQSMSESVTV